MAESQADLRRLREITTSDVMLHQAHPDFCCVGQDAYFDEVREDHQQFPFKSFADIRVTPKPWGIFLTARERFTEVASGNSGERHRRIGLSLRGQQVSEIFDCTTPWGPRWKKAPPSRFEMRYIGGWPGLDTPIDVVTLQIRDGYVSLLPGGIPDTSLATHVLSGRGGQESPLLGGCKLEFFVGANVGHGRNAQHSAAGSDLAWGALGGVGLVGSLASSAGLRADLSTLLGAATGAGVVAAAQRWVEPLDRIVIAVAPGEIDPFWFVLEELPAQGNDKRKLPPGSGEPLALWDALQRAIVDGGSGLPIRSMAGAAALSAQAGGADGAPSRGPDALPPGPSDATAKNHATLDPQASSHSSAASSVQPPEAGQTRSSEPSGEEPLSAGALAQSLEHLKELVDKGLLSDAEFADAKAELLRRFGANAGRNSRDGIA